MLSYKIHNSNHSVCSNCVTYTDLISVYILNINLTSPLVVECNVKVNVCPALSPLGPTRTFPPTTFPHATLPPNILMMMMTVRALLIFSRTQFSVQRWDIASRAAPSPSSSPHIGTRCSPGRNQSFGRIIWWSIGTLTVMGWAEDQLTGDLLGMQCSWLCRAISCIQSSIQWEYIPGVSGRSFSMRSFR